jgi:hypothetical protein
MGKRMHDSAWISKRQLRIWIPRSSRSGTNRPGLQRAERESWPAQFAHNDENFMIIMKDGKIYRDTPPKSSGTDGG